MSDAISGLCLALVLFASPILAEPAATCSEVPPALWKELLPRCPPSAGESCTPGNPPGGGCTCSIVCVPNGDPSGADCWRPQAICLDPD